jgi:hypothetical protein
MNCKIWGETLVLTSQGYAHSDGKIYRTCPVLIKAMLSGELSVRLPRPGEEASHDPVEA